MQITDEAVDIVYLMLDGKTYSKQTVRIALEAGLSAVMPAQVSVKPLEFVDLSDKSIAHTPFGTYGCGFSITGSTTEPYQMVIAGGELPKSFHQTLKAAKAAAQADYSARILSALSISPAPVDGGATPPQPNVKPLNWIVRGHSKDKPVVHAGAFGVARFYTISGSEGDWTLSYPGADCMLHMDGFKTQHAARTAAQANYDDHVLSALATEGKV